MHFTVLNNKTPRRSQMTAVYLSLAKPRSSGRALRGLDLQRTPIPAQSASNSSPSGRGKWSFTSMTCSDRQLPAASSAAKLLSALPYASLKLSLNEAAVPAQCIRTFCAAFVGWLACEWMPGRMVQPGLPSASTHTFTEADGWPGSHTGSGKYVDGCRSCPSSAIAPMS